MSELIQLRKKLFSEHHRNLVILSGDQQWQNTQIQDLYKKHETVFWVTANSCHADEPNVTSVPETFAHYGFECIESKRLPYYLGQEISGAIIDVRNGYSADTIGIIAGMLQAGGLFILLTPTVEAWQNLNNPENSRFLNTPLSSSDANTAFTQHLIQSWQSEDIIWIEQDNPTQAVPFSLVADNRVQTQALPTNDQESAIKAIHSVAFGHRKRPLVITADRGRGKSSVLGLAAIDCLMDGKQHIALTASRLDQTKAAFKHAQNAIEALVSNGLEIEVVVNKPGLLTFTYQSQTKTLEFIAPDFLILNPTTADVLMVDEAAHLPTPLLVDILTRHHRLVFATTLHGYEGSGRGFELRFKKQLDIRTPNWKQCHLNQPIRWADHDPLENAINRALLLDTPLVEIADGDVFDSITPLDLNFHTISSEELLADRAMLESLFGLLVQAHYQTSPNDLQQLLNAPNIKVVTACIQPGHVIGAVLCIEEGKLGPSHNRAHGHLVPQLLTKHYAQTDFLMLSTWRVMRIAVHPAYQRNGIGQHLLQEVETLANLSRVDYISSSFGASEELLPFWIDQHFWPLHVGVKRDKASGSHNLVLAKPLTAMARQALSLIQTRFQDQFPHLLLESLPHLPANQVWQILQTFRFKKRNLGLNKAMALYQDGTRPYESISNKLWEWSLQSAQIISQSSHVNQAIWCDKVLKKNSWQDVAHQHHLPGRKGVEQALKDMLQDWVPSTSQQTPKLGLTAKKPSFGY